MFARKNVVAQLVEELGCWLDIRYIVVQVPVGLEISLLQTVQIGPEAHQSPIQWIRVIFPRKGWAG
jgi:hypothetical protein